MLNARMAVGVQGLGLIDEDVDWEVSLEGVT